MDECFSLLRLWKAEKDLILYFNELNTYHDLLQGSLDDYDQEDKELLAIDIDNALTAISDRFSIEQKESDEHVSAEQARNHIEALHDYIISTADIAFATDIAEADPIFADVQKFLTKYARKIKKPCRSFQIIEAIKENIYDIIAWAELQYVHQNMDIHSVISSRTSSALMIISRNPESDNTHEQAKDSIDSTKAFRSCFTKEFDGYKIAQINARINELSKNKEEGYVSKIAALIAVLFTNKVLIKTYKDTLTHIFKRLGIKEDASSYKPAQFKRCSIKGTVPATWTEAEEFFNSL